MNTLNDIKHRIKGIEQTRQITKAMETVSIAKARKASARYHNNLLYFNRVRETIRGIISHSHGIENVFLHKEAAGGKRAVFIVISGDKGLAGSYNHNVLNLAWRAMEEYKERYVFTVGQMAREFFERKNITVDVEFTHMTLDPTVGDARHITESVVNLYSQNLMDEVFIVYTKKEGAGAAAPEVIKLLPLGDAIWAETDGKEGAGFYEEVHYEPSAEQVLDVLVPQYMTALIYGCLLRSVASEHSCRVAAMSSATRNATDIINRLKLAYNRARQEAVTEEVIEITACRK